eukprot:15787021-Heterocapsa_arctica.AAC.1
MSRQRQCRRRAAGGNLAASASAGNMPQPEIRVRQELFSLSYHVLCSHRVHVSQELVRRAKQILQRCRFAIVLQASTRLYFCCWRPGAWAGCAVARAGVG